MFAGRRQNDVILGVGSVPDAPTAALFIASGANFIVSPSLNPEVARLCNRRKIPYLPGCLTPTEIATAEELGVEICKIFPGNVGGPEFISAVMAPCPWTRLLPTGGVDATEESVNAWIKAGAGCGGHGLEAHHIVAAQGARLRRPGSQGCPDHRVDQGRSLTVRRLTPRSKVESPEWIATLNLEPFNLSPCSYLDGEHMTSPHLRVAFSPLPDPAAVVCGPGVRFTVLTSRLIRMEHSSAEQFEDHPSQAFWYRRQPVPQFRRPIPTYGIERTAGDASPSCAFPHRESKSRPSTSA